MTVTSKQKLFTEKYIQCGNGTQAVLGRLPLFVPDHFEENHVSNPWQVFENLVDTKLALIDDFRTANWVEIIKYPELVYQKSVQFLI